MQTKPIMSAYLQWRHAEKVLSSCRRDRGSSRSALLFRVWLGPDPRVHQPQEFGYGPHADGVGAPAKAKQVDVVTFLVVVYQKSIGGENIVIEAIPGH